MNKGKLEVSKSNDSTSLHKTAVGHNIMAKPLRGNSEVLSLSTRTYEPTGTPDSELFRKSGQDTNGPDTEVSYLGCVCDEGYEVPEKCSSLSKCREVAEGRVQIRRLQNEVALLERQLAEKTHASGQHIMHLSDIRAKLASEKTALSVCKEKVKSSAAMQLEQAERVYTQRCQELQNRVEKLAMDKMNSQKDLDKTKLLLKASQLESSALSQRLATLTSQLESERTALSGSIQNLKSEVASGRQQVMQLEQALSSNCKELESCVAVMESSAQEFKSKIKELQEQVESLSSDLAQARKQLLKKSDINEALRKQIVQVCSQEEEVKKNMEQKEALFRSLLQEFQELKVEHQKAHEELRVARKEKNDIDTILKQKQLRESDFKLNLQHLNLRLQQERRKRKETESKAERLEKDMTAIKMAYEKCMEEVDSHKAKTRKLEEEMEEMLGHMQQELSNRTQQVLEMDGLLKNLQAETTSRRLHLERLLAQKQAELRARTLETDKLMMMLNESKERENQLQHELGLLKHQLTPESKSSVLH